MKISIIAAIDDKRGIGKNNKIPWHLKDDLIKLKRLTKDHVVVLGRKTYDSMVWYYNKSGKQMPGKLYIVITHDKGYKPTRENAAVTYSLEEAISFARSHLAKLSSVIPNLIGNLDSRFRGKDYKESEIFIIGGAQIFQQALPLADKLYLTIVEGDFNCDTFFPDYSAFRKVVSEESKESEGYKYRFLEVER
jgi:dihydrofolate reductase